MSLVLPCHVTDNVMERSIFNNVHYISKFTLRFASIYSQEHYVKNTSWKSFYLQTGRSPINVSGRLHDRKRIFGRGINFI